MLHVGLGLMAQMREIGAITVSIADISGRAISSGPGNFFHFFE